METLPRFTQLCELSFDPDQTHLKELIEVLRISTQSQTGVFDQGRSYTQWISRARGSIRLPMNLHPLCFFRKPVIYTVLV